MSWERQVKAQIRKRYAAIAGKGGPIGGAADKALDAGYPAQWLEKLRLEKLRLEKPRLDNLPTDLAASYSGCGYLFEDLDISGAGVVVDLGAGAGFDACFAGDAGPGLVIAVDFTPEMLARVASAAAALSLTNVRALGGDMEALPLAAEIADIVLANASFNLTLDKPKAFAEAWRILRPGGRLIARDLVRDGELPREVLEDPQGFNTSLGGAVEEGKLADIIAAAGFEDVCISHHRKFSYLTAVRIEASKPR